MKRNLLVLSLFSLLIISACSARKNFASVSGNSYTPDSQELYDTIVSMDAQFFEAYNTCDLESMRTIFADTIEFYHDKGGLTTSKDELMESLKNNICGKVTRRLVKGSVEVYPIGNYGAVQIGFHQFYNNQEKDAGYSRPGKFIAIWKKEKSGWRMSRVVSLH